MKSDVRIGANKKDVNQVFSPFWDYVVALATRAKVLIALRFRWCSVYSRDHATDGRTKSIGAFSLARLQ